MGPICELRHKSSAQIDRLDFVPRVSPSTPPLRAVGGTGRQQSESGGHHESIKVSRYLAWGSSMLCFHCGVGSPRTG